MSAFYAFGSGMLEQSLENKRAAAERKFELAKMITPYVLEKKDLLDKRVEKANTAKNNLLSNGFTENQIGLGSQLTNNGLVEADDPLASMGNIIETYYGGDRDAFEADAERVGQTATGISTLQDKQGVLKQNMSDLGLAPEGLFEFYYNYGTDQQAPVEGADPAQTMDTTQQAAATQTVTPDINFATTTDVKADFFANNPQTQVAQILFDLGGDKYSSEFSLTDYINRDGPNSFKSDLAILKEKDPDAHDFLISAIGDNTIAGVTGASVDELKAKTQLETAVSKIMLMQDPVAKQNALNELSVLANGLFPNSAQEVLNELAQDMGAQSYVDLYPAQ